jgi:spore coat polysaccharide biosynthesis protein SpsF
MPKIVASVEARMGSSRLPGKVLMDVAGQPLLLRLFNRLRACKMLDDVVLATTTKKLDDELEEFAIQHCLPIYRGSENDVLDRVVKAHEMMKTDIVVEFTGDCPLVDPEIVDYAIDMFLHNHVDIVSNVRIPSFPEGVDVQVFRADALKHVSDTVNDPAVREHVSLFFYENPKSYRVLNMLAPTKWRLPGQRLQVDYEEDLRLVRLICDNLIPKYGELFGLSQVIDLLKNCPEMRSINTDCKEKPLR